MKKFKSKFLTRKGFLMVEVLLAIIIISVSLTVIIQSLGSTLRASILQGEYSLATILAENKMFDVLIKPVSELNLDEGVFEDPFDRYSHALEIDSFEAGDTEGIDVVSLEVAWPKKKKIFLSTYLFSTEEKEE